MTKAAQERNFVLSTPFSILNDSVLIKLNYKTLACQNYARIKEIFLEDWRPVIIT